MPSPIGAKPRARGRYRRTVMVLLGLIAALVAAVYVAWPWLVAAAAPHLAPLFGLEQLTVRVERPGLHGMAVPFLKADAGRLEVTAEDGRIRYDLGGLVAGRLEQVVFRRVAVALTEPVEGGGGGAAAAPPDVDAALAALPAERVVVEHLELAVPALDFRSTGALVADRQRLTVELAGVAPAQARDFHLQMTASAGAGIHLRLAGDGPAEAPILEVTSTVAGRALRLEGELTLGGLALDLAANLAGLPAGDGRVSGTFAGRLPWPPDGDRPWFGATGEGRLSARWRPRGQSWPLPEVAARWRLSDAGLAGELAATAPGNGVSPLLEAEWSLAPDLLSVAGTFRIDAAELGWLPDDRRPPGNGALSGRFTARTPWPLPEGWQALDATAAGTLTGQWRIQDGRLGLDPLAGDWRLDERAVSAALDATAIYQELQLPMTLELERLTPTASGVAARGRALLSGTLEVPFELDRRAGAGRLTARVDHRIGAPLAAALFQDWQAPYDVVGGQVGVNATVRWGAEPVDATASVRLHGVDAHYGEFRLSDLEAELELASDAGVWSLSPTRLHAGAIDTGVVLQDVEAGIAWSGDLLTIDGAETRLLGGSARVAPFAYDLAAGRADFVIDLAGLDLARVLALEGEHISGTGTLTGSLPVRIRDHRPSVVAGEVRAEPPGGVIRVSPTLARGTGQPGLDFALRALRNFHYTRLEADVAYTGAGDLTLAVHLQGHNPDIQDGRPIHYNLTVTENVPTLLRSLRLQERVTREIERRLTD